MIDNDNVEVSDEGEYIQKQGGIKDILLRHIRKIGDICCKELTGGYWEKKPFKTQSGTIILEEYHEDLREAYCNAMDFLIDIIFPMGDAKLKDYLVKHESLSIDYGDDVKLKLKGKRITFREINQMFERTNFWQGTESYDE